jgi:hypothetical protein
VPITGNKSLGIIAKAQWTFTGWVIK